jgi:hypothetical protein
MEIKKLLAAATMIGLTFGSAHYVRAEELKGHGLVEIAAGEEIVLDTQLMVPITKDLSLVHRNRPIWNYEKDLSVSYMLRGSHKVTRGLTAELGVAGSSEVGLIPRVGLGYFGTFGGVNFLQVGLPSLNGDLNFLSITGATYRHPSSDCLSLVISGENTGLISKEGWLPILQQASLGIGYGNLEVGVLGELTNGKAVRGFVRGRF